MKFKTLSLLILSVLIALQFACKKRESEKDLLMAAIEEYETAWASGDFLKVDSFFADDAKRLHTEPEVWDRQMITDWCKKKAAEQGKDLNPVVKDEWKKGRNYLGIRVEGNLAYDVFTTHKFKALHIWEKQKNGQWKIIYDMGMLNYPCDEAP